MSDIRKTGLDFKTLMDWLKEKYPYSMLRWVNETYWIETELQSLSEKAKKDG